jgi:poly-gamma-glutamate synthesis protein (capsule biosynthesis protein)
VVLRTSSLSVANAINLETSIARSDEFAPGKAVHYRMNPDNFPCVRSSPS